MGVLPVAPTEKPVPPAHAPTSSAGERFRTAVRHAAHLLPAQGPITVFIHHNTLHAFEQLPFDQAVRAGAARFGCEPYLSEVRYREALNRGRIRFADLQAELLEKLGPTANASIAGLCSRLELRLRLLQYPLARGATAELRWVMAESDALRRMRSDVSAVARGRLLSDTRRWVMRDLRGNGQTPEWIRDLFDRFDGRAIEAWSADTWEAFSLEALWQVCRLGVQSTPLPSSALVPLVRHRDLLLHATGLDIDPWVHDVLIRFTAAFLDQGVSHWPLPGRDLGFFRSFCTLYAQPFGSPDRWLRSLRHEVAQLLQAGTSPVESACQSLDALGVAPQEWEVYLEQTLLALRGWAGMIYQIERRGDRVAHPIAAGSLDEFVAVRLLLEKQALTQAARQTLAYSGSLSRLREELRRRIPPPAPPDVDERAFAVFQLAQIMGWSPAELFRLSGSAWSELLNELETFSELQRRELFHLAYERRLREQSLDALALHNPPPPVVQPKFQVVACLDEREESFRRHLEEVAPECETFGVAGFFAVPMYYRGATDAHFVPLCPIVVTPKHWVEECPIEELEEAHSRTLQTRRLLGAAAHRVHLQSRTFALGALLSSTLGLLASVPLVLRILFPHLTGRLRSQLGRFVAPPSRTRLTLDRPADSPPGPQPGHLGFTVQERTDQAERLLRDIGLTQRFAPLVLLIGHGSNSLNNPHKSAYDCGACGGSPGGPNSRTAAALLNDAAVRANLLQRGIRIPADCYFVGGYHNTCDDSVQLFDLEAVPATHRAALEAVQQRLEIACERNAHERCRRFQSAPLSLTPAEARRHVQGRSEDLAQPRPELGHATNALCIVGRRERTRGLFLDRRAFLTSYDPTSDPPGAPILTRLLQAVFPVCAGINLEYYFSHVDSMGYGCGTKLPHNVTALLGVMDGAASDLRTGLPWQMVEFHEPVRLLIVCETTEAILLDVLKKNPSLGTLADNGWVQLAVLHPDRNTLAVYRQGRFQPYTPTAHSLPVAASSFDWYRGWREHLEFASIVAVPENPSAAAGGNHA